MIDTLFFYLIKILKYFKLVYFNLSYSQEGEDIILYKIFKGKKNGFYIDIGAHHPKRLSNTYLFYLNGWSGINIDPIKGLEKKFNKSRSRDQTFELAIDIETSSKKYYSFNEPAFNSFNKELSLKREEQSNLKYIVKESYDVKTMKLSSLLSKYLNTNKVIDFFSIDVEGYELNILMSNDWKKYRPTYIIIEILRSGYNKNEIIDFLNKENYYIFSILYNSYIFKHK